MKNDSNTKRLLAHGAIWVALSGAIAACGKTADVLTSHADAGASGSDEDGSAGGGAGKRGGKGSTGGDANGGASGGGKGGAGAGFRVLPDGGVVFAPDGGTPDDPHAEERHSLVNQFCALLDKYPCLTSPAYLGLQGSGAMPTQAQRVEACRDDLNLAGFNGPTGTPAPCWDDWVATMKCRIAQPYQCPCDSNDCTLYPPGNASSAPSFVQCGSDAYVACLQGQPDGQSATVTGSRMSCNAHWDRTSCTVLCGPDKGARSFYASCSGPPGDPYQCDVMLNAYSLSDDITGKTAQFYADDCRSVAQAMANGEDGVNDVDCCFTWHVGDAGAGANESRTPGAHCSCTADPTKAGFATCAAAAAAGHGEVIDLCPQYEPLPAGGFPGGP